MAVRLRGVGMQRETSGGRGGQRVREPGATSARPGTASPSMAPPAATSPGSGRGSPAGVPPGPAAIPRGSSASMSAGAARRPPAAARPGLRRELGLWETAALSIGLMAPTLAMSLTGVGPAGLLGQAAPLAFVFAAVGVLVVSYGFVRLSGAFAHAGSVYAFVGRTLGPRAGFLTSWALLGTYLVFPAVSIAGVAVFGQAFLRATGWAPGADWFPIAVAGWAVIWLLAARGVRPNTRSLLAFEAVSVLLILVLVGVIFAKLGAGTAPNGATLSWDFLRLPPGTAVGTVALAATFGFLAFAGFESAGSLGEESRRPTRAVPRAILLAVAVGAAFYIICMIAQTLGFGTSPAGVNTFAGSTAPLNDLAQSYVGSGLAAVLDAGAVLSAVGAGLGGVMVGARMMFAFGRDGLLVRPLARVSPASGTPRLALAVEMLVAIALLTGFRIEGTAPLRAFFYLATIGVLNLLVMYVLTNVAAARYLWQHSHSLLQLLLPAAGVAVASYVLYRNVWPQPEGPFAVLPYLCAGWLGVGLLAALLIPSLPGRVAAGLAAQRADAGGAAG